MENIECFVFLCMYCLLHQGDFVWSLCLSRWDGMFEKLEWNGSVGTIHNICQWKHKISVLLCNELKMQVLSCLIDVTKQFYWQHINIIRM